MYWKTLALCCALVPALSAAQEAPLKNWFNDPFIQVRNNIPQCPLPLGPLQTEQEMKEESHSRVERGTSCWLAGKCAEPNAYRYDAPIAKAVEDHFRSSDAFQQSSLWITVKRRFVWVEGCVDPAISAAALEAAVKSIPDVERVLVNIMPGTAGKPPYLVARQTEQ